MYRKIRSSFDTVDSKGFGDYRSDSDKKKSRLVKKAAAIAGIGIISFSLAYNGLFHTKNDAPYTPEKSISSKVNNNREYFKDNTNMYGVPLEDALREHPMELQQRPDTLKAFNINMYQLLRLDSDDLEVLDDTFNGVVIDIKETDGHVAKGIFDASYQENSLFPADSSDKERLEDKLDLLGEYDFYRIARVCAFKDNSLARSEPKRAIYYRQDMSLFETNDGYAWLDIYNADNWEHISDIVSEVAYNLPFEEINLDYIRSPAIDPDDLIFPSKVDFEENIGREAQNSDAINSFVRHLSMKTIKYGVNLSYDLYGSSVIYGGDDYYGRVLGQDFVEISRAGYVYGMFYTTHYGKSQHFSEDWLERVAQIAYWSYQDGNRILKNNNLPTDRLGGFIEDIYRNNSGKEELRKDQLLLSWDLVTDKFNKDCIIWSADIDYLKEIFIPNLTDFSSDRYLDFARDSRRAWNAGYYEN